MVVSSASYRNAMSLVCVLQLKTKVSSIIWSVACRELVKLLMVDCAIYVSKGRLFNQRTALHKKILVAHAKSKQ